MAERCCRSEEQKALYLAPFVQLPNGEWLNLDGTRPRHATAVVVLGNSTENAVQLIRLFEHHCNLLMPSRHAKRHLCEVPNTGDKKHFGQYEHHVGLGFDAGRDVIVVGFQHTVTPTSYDPHSDHGEGDKLPLLILDHAARFHRLITAPAVCALMHPRRLHHLVSVSPEGHAGQLAGAGFEAKRKISVVRTQPTVARGSQCHRESHFLECVLVRAAARFPRLTSVTASSTLAHLLRVDHLASVALKTHRKPSRTTLRKVGSPWSPW